MATTPVHLKTPMTLPLNDREAMLGIVSQATPAETMVVNFGGAQAEVTPMNVTLTPEENNEIKELNQRLERMTVNYAGLCSSISFFEKQLETVQSDASGYCQQLEQEVRAVSVNLSTAKQTIEEYAAQREEYAEKLKQDVKMEISTVKETIDQHAVQREEELWTSRKRVTEIEQAIKEMLETVTDDAKIKRLETVVQRKFDNADREIRNQIERIERRYNEKIEQVEKRVLHIERYGIKMEK